jgi:Rrf2 family protein
MKFSMVEDYSLRCLSLLARFPGQRLTIGRIAESEGLSDENTAKILARLRDAGLVDSYRGKEGGYALSRPASQISVADVLGGVGGAFFELDLCRGVDESPACVHESECAIRSVWSTLGDVIREFLGRVSLADLMKPENAVHQALNRERIELDASRFEPSHRLPSLKSQEVS